MSEVGKLFDSILDYKLRRENAIESQEQTRIYYTKSGDIEHIEIPPRKLSGIHVTVHAPQDPLLWLPAWWVKKPEPRYVETDRLDAFGDDPEYKSYYRPHTPYDPLWNDKNQTTYKQWSQSI